MFLRFNVCTGRSSLGSQIHSPTFPCSVLWRANLCRLHFPSSLVHWLLLRLGQWATLLETGRLEEGSGAPHCTWGGTFSSSLHGPSSHQTFFMVSVPNVDHLDPASPSLTLRLAAAHLFSAIPTLYSKFPLLNFLRWHTWLRLALNSHWILADSFIRSKILKRLKIDNLENRGEILIIK